MELTTVSCNSCGAPLRIPVDARFVTCNHCSCQLEVKHNESVTFTKHLGEINERTERIEEDLAELTYRQTLEDIDREWEQEREQYMVTNKHGHRHIPSMAGSGIGCVVIVGFGLFWTVMASQVGGGPFALFGVLFIVIGVVTSVISYNKAEAYRSAERDYHLRRADAARGRR